MTREMTVCYHVEMVYVDVGDAHSVVVYYHDGIRYTRLSATPDRRVRLLMKHNCSLLSHEPLALYYATTPLVIVATVNAECRLTRRLVTEVMNTPSANTVTLRRVDSRHSHTATIVYHYAMSAAQANGLLVIGG